MAQHEYKGSSGSKNRVYCTFFIIELYIFLSSFRNIVNIVLYAILFQPFEYQGVYTRPSEMLLSNQGRMKSCAKIAIQIAKTYIYLTPLSVLSTSVAASGLEKITFKVRQ